ncbi:MAG: CrcB family protein [Propionibacteriaceae bacterium]
MDELPLDSDPGDGPLVAPHRRPLLWLVVWLGGTAGTGVRFLISEATPVLWRVPVAILGINIVGAFLLGVLMAALQRRGPDVGRRQVIRLLLGTGFLGGFTTYSALAVDSVTLLRGGLLAHALLYAGCTVLVGGLASFVGLAAGQRVPVRRQAA